jgi:hypothetical protein
MLGSPTLRDGKDGEVGHALSSGVGATRDIGKPTKSQAV